MPTDTAVTKYISLFHHRDHAASALRDLEAAAVPNEDITVISGGNQSYGLGYQYNAAEDLSNFGVPPRDLKHLQDGVRDGGIVLIVEGVSTQQAAIEKIFHKYSATKIDETETPMSNFDDAYDEAPLAAAAVPAAYATEDTGKLVTDRFQTGNTAESGVIPVIEEDMVVGKREVERGGVRVFSRMVEEPVSAEVNLREEHAVIERRTVDRPVTDADLRTGQVIELRETAEEAVVGKTARVVEEVLVGKQATEHTETVSDTVRHTEVEVEPVATTTTATTPRSSTY